MAEEVETEPKQQHPRLAADGSDVQPLNVEGPARGSSTDVQSRGSNLTRPHRNSSVDAGESREWNAGHPADGYGEMPLLRAASESQIGLVNLCSDRSCPPGRVELSVAMFHF
jgi:hypothetical protein